MKPARRNDSEMAALSEFCDWVLDLPADGPEIERFQGIIRLLIKFARPYVANHRMPAEEAIDIIVSGWLQYDDRFDPERGFKYSTYIGTAVRNMLRDPRHRRSVVHLPVTAWPQIKACYAAQKDLRHELGRHPSLEEVAERAGLTKGTRRSEADSAELAGMLLRASQIANKAHKRLNYELKEGETPSFTLEAPEEELPRELPELDELIAGLSPRERLIIVGRFRHEMHLSELGRLLSLSAERVRQIQESALERLRATVTVDPDEVYA